MKKISEEDMKDYMIAAAIFAMGQNEKDSKALMLIEELSKRDAEVKLIDPKDIPDDELVSQVWQRGGGGYRETRVKDVEDMLGPFKEAYEKRDWSCFGKTLEKAAKELSKFIDKEIFSYVACCTSPSQGIIPMYVAALEEKPFVDGDCTGTALRPHLCRLGGIYRAPAAFVTPYGETITAKDIPEGRLNKLYEYVNYSTGSWYVACAGGVADIKRYRDAMVKNQASRLITVGRAVRKAREERGDPVKAFMKAAPAYKLFEGNVESFTREMEKGRLTGYWNIKGLGEFMGHELKIWYEMENRISWLDEEAYVTIPDLICVVDSETCESKSNFDHKVVRINETKKEEKVTVLGVEADKAWYNLDGAISAINAQIKRSEFLGYGFDIKHKPLKEVIS